MSAPKLKDLAPWLFWEIFANLMPNLDSFVMEGYATVVEYAAN